jgi:VanZ family protein
MNSRLRQTVAAFAPAAAWQGLILLLSTSVAAGKQTLRVLTTLNHLLGIGLTSPALASLNVGMRKATHVLVYLVLAILLARGFRRLPWLARRVRGWRLALAVLPIVLLGALADEFHQKVVPSRTGSGWDVALDVSGGVLGLLLLWFWDRWKQYRPAAGLAAVAPGLPPTDLAGIHPAEPHRAGRDPAFLVPPGRLDPFPPRPRVRPRTQDQPAPQGE